MTRQNILGIHISAIDMPQAVETVRGWIDARAANYICVTPAHSVMDAYRDPALKEILNSSGLTTPDGMSIVWLLKSYRHRSVQRVYGPDLLLALCAAGLQSGWRHYFYGGQPGVAQKLADVLSERFANLQVAGVYSPPFRGLTDEEKASVTDEIKASAADIVWVGLSAPRQEFWMAEFVHRINQPVLIGIGAAFDFISGAKPQAPRWMQRMGLEWVFRLINEPARLWPRYSRYPLFVCLALGQRLGLLHFGRDA
jgi:N-acetylglucosaminyldiphosphoundecaprenol N-acetyl-beta-D-mannosaminyltransferase